MKKMFFATMALMMSLFTVANAQTVEKSRFFDNWSLGLKGGAVTPMNHAAFWGDMRGVIGLELHKNITPVWGLGLEGQWMVNTSNWNRFIHSTTAFDEQMVGVYGTFNLMNAIGGYNGSPRLFEINVNAGIGWLHTYRNNHKFYNEVYGNSFSNGWYSKFGPDLNFNLGNARAWTVSLKPAFVYNMQYPGATGYNINHGYFEILAGITYNFKNSNGTHSFKLCDKKYTQAEWDAIMEEVNALRAREPEVKVIEKVVEVERVVNVETPEIIGNAIGFKLNSAVVEETEYASLSNVADWLKENPNAKIAVVGYADKDTGTAVYNEQLSLNRANNVKDILVNTFDIDSNRLIVHGEGDVIQPYLQNNWNRVVIFKVLN